MTCSMSAKGNCWERSTSRPRVGSTASRTRECTAFATPPTSPAMKAASFEYIEGLYNWKRHHSTLGYRSPVQFVYGDLDQQATSERTGRMKPTLWQTKNRGRLNDRTMVVTPDRLNLAKPRSARPAPISLCAWICYWKRLLPASPPGQHSPSPLSTIRSRQDCLRQKRTVGWLTNLNLCRNPSPLAG